VKLRRLCVDVFFRSIIEITSIIRPNVFIIVVRTISRYGDTGGYVNCLYNGAYDDLAVLPVRFGTATGVYNLHSRTIWSRIDGHAVRVYAPR